LVLIAASSIPLSLAALFQLALLTMLCLHRGDFVPHAHGSSEDGLGRDHGCHTPGTRTLDSPPAVADDGRPLGWPPAAAVAYSFSHPGGHHHHLVLIGQCAYPTPQQDPLSLPGVNY
jgi:hypothetical protein